MYPSNYDHKPGVFDLREFLWKMLFQWKALLLFSLIIAILVPCIKYAKDSKAYNSSVASVQKEINSAEDPASQIDKLLSSLPDSDRRSVKQALWQDQQISDLGDYICESILMNIDFDSARVVEEGFQITGIQDPQDIEAIQKGYESAFDDSFVLEALGNLIAPDMDAKYVRELISFSHPYNVIDSNNSIYSPDSSSSLSGSSCVFSVFIVIPDSSDEEAVKSMVSSMMEKRNFELSNSVAKHNIKAYHSESANAVLSQISDRREAISEQLVFLRNNQKVFLSNLSQQQRAAYESASRIKFISEMASSGSKDDAVTAVAGVKPEFSKKYAIEGFIAGIILYAVLLFLYLRRKNTLNSSGEVQYYTESKLLGEYYYDSKGPGFCRLFHSKKLSQLRFSKHMDLQQQVILIANRLRDSFEVDSDHSTDLILFSDVGGIGSSFAEALAKECDNDSISISPFSSSEYSAGKTASPAVLLITEKTRISHLESVMRVCRQYNKRLLGAIYISEV